MEIEALLVPWRARLKNYLVRTLGDRDEADDVYGETMLRTVKGFGDYRGKGEFGAWLFAICRNVLKEKFRRDKKTRLLLERLDNESAVAPFEVSPEELLIAGPDARKQAVVDALNAISEHQRRLVMLILFSGYTMDEAAREMELSDTAVRKLASRAVRALRGILVQRGEIDA